MASLQGKRVLVTRSRTQATELASRLAERGAHPILFPTITFMRLDPAPLLRVLDSRAQFDWLLFTSANAVSYFLDVAELPPPGRLKVAAVGLATTRCLEAVGRVPDFVPDQFTAVALARGLGDLSGRRLLLPRSRRGRPDIVTQLQAQGGEVVDIPIYDTLTAVPAPSAWAGLATGIDIATFTSPSSVRSFLDIVTRAPAEVGPLDWSSISVACLGPVTAEAAAAAGLPVDIVPVEYHIDALLNAIEHSLGERSV